MIQSFWVAGSLKITPLVRRGHLWRKFFEKIAEREVFGSQLLQNKPVIRSARDRNASGTPPERPAVPVVLTYTKTNT